jgi:copper chaperone CopZ
MTCVGCASGVQSILQSFNGIIEADISYDGGKGEIIYDPTVITKEQIINSKAFSTYPAEIVHDEKLEK